MSWIVLVPFLALGIFLLLFLLLVQRLRETVAGRIFGAILLSLAAWSFCSWLMHVGASPSAYFWLVAGFAFAVAISPLLVHFATEYPRHKPGIRWLVMLWYGMALVFEAGNLLGKFVERATFIPGSGGVVDIEFGPMMNITWPYLVLSVLIVAAIFIHSYRSTNSRAERLLLRYPLIGTVVLFGGGSLNAFPGLSGYPLDILANITFALVIGSGISRHQFLNVRLLLRRNLSNIALVLVLSALFVFILRGVQYYIGEASSVYLWLMMVPIAGALTAIFYGMRSRLQSKVDRLFFGEQYDYRETVLRFSQKMGDSLKLDSLTGDLLRMLCRSLNCEKAGLALRSSRGDSYDVRASVGFADQDLLGDIHVPSNNPFMILAGRHVKPLSRTEIEVQAGPGNAPMADASWMNVLSCELICPLLIGDNMVGFIALGRKRTGERYSDEDLLLLSTVSNQAAVATDNARLYEESQLAYEQLQLAQEQLVQAERLKAMGQMSSGIAHDFNNVLTTILGRVQLALRGVQDAKLRRNMEIIEQSALDAAQMVRRLQDATRMRTDQYFELVDMNQIIESALENIKPRLDELLETKDARIRTVFDRTQISPVEGSAGELREVMANILLNAVEAMPGGGELTLKSQQQNNRVAVTVSDTGVGMSAEVKSKLFTPFFTTKGSKGLGMGLSVSYGIINRHGGSIEVSSEPGKGSAFTIKFPVAKRGQDKVISKTPEIDTGNATILVIDDDEGARHVISETLSEVGHKVDIAVNGQEGLSLARKKVYDLVVADLGMPDISGRQVARAIKSDNPMIPVLLITGWGVQLDPLELEKDGVDGLIAKPFKSEEILTEVAKLLPPETESSDV